MWLTQKMSTSPSTDPKQQQMQQMMQWMMPLFIGFIFLTFPCGLALYIIIMNIIRMIVQYFLTGKWRSTEAFIQHRFSAMIPAGHAPLMGPEQSVGEQPEGWTPSEDRTTQKEKSPQDRKSGTAIEKGKGRQYGRTRSKRKKRR